MDDYQRFMGGMGAGQIGSGLYGLLGRQSNPADAANRYINRIPSEAGQYYNPYIQQGQSAYEHLNPEYENLISHPGQRMNEIGQDFHESPGFKFALEQALGAGDRAAAAGGMAGTPSHQQHNMELATNLGNQEYYNWLNPALNLHSQGMQGEQGFYNAGQAASNSMADLIAQQLAQQGAYGYEGQAAKNANRSNSIGNILGGLGSFGAFF